MVTNTDTPRHKANRGESSENVTTVAKTILTKRKTDNKAFIQSKLEDVLCRAVYAKYIVIGTNHIVDVQLHHFWLLNVYYKAEIYNQGPRGDT